MVEKKAKRDRGRILSEAGWLKLDEALQQWEMQTDQRRTFEKIAAEATLDPGTVAKIFKRKEGADLSKIEQLFRAFQLNVEAIDHCPVPQGMAQSADPNFVGRAGAIADLNALVERGARVIVIQARGGVGKTSLARKYLQQEFGSFLEFPIAKETKDIASIESLIEEKLKQLGEEPGREFLVSIDRLKRKLQSEAIGILIDNLEPALDSSGKFIEPHRRYVELLRVLSDPSVQSVTLITSRERLFEPSVSVQHYLLNSLDVAAWEQFFQLRLLSPDVPSLAALHRAYGGNAKAMEIISSAIQTDHAGDVAAYWQVNQDDLLIERALEDLVTQQFDRLQQLDLDAYNLLCRMGCYRYQDVPTVSIEGLFCLLWDVSENRWKRVVRVLQERSMVDVKDGEYWLHPVIRSEAIGRLKEGEDWNLANCKAADLWETYARDVKNIGEVRVAFESFYHYVEIDDFEQAGGMIMKKVSGIKERSLGDLLFYMGSATQVISAIERIEKELKSGSSIIKLYDLLGHSYAMKGNPQKALIYHEKVKEIATFHSINSYNLFSLFNIGFRKIELWEIDQALTLLEAAQALSKKLFLEDKKYYKYQILSQCYLAFLESTQEIQCDIKDFALSAYSEIFEVNLTDWNLGCGLVCLGLAFRQCGENEFSYKCYIEAMSLAIQKQYPRLEAWALFRLGNLCCERPSLYNLDSSEIVVYHRKAIEILNKMGAKGDLAEAFYQLGLTYQVRNDLMKSDENFQEAIRLFTEMQAPKQVDRVRRSMQNNI